MVPLSFSSRDQVACFIEELRDALAEGYGLTVVNRQKNRNALTRLGMNYKDVRLQLMRLSVGHYVSGPEKDAGGYPGVLWIFRLPVETKQLYVKLNLLHYCRRIICLSFHEEAYDVKTPYEDCDTTGREGGSLE